MTGPVPPPERFLHIVRFNPLNAELNPIRHLLALVGARHIVYVSRLRVKASSFRWEYPRSSLRSSSNFLRLLPLLLVTSISPFIFPSITCRIRQFLRSMCPIQSAFCFRISCRIFLCSLTLSNTSSFLTWSIQLIFSILLQHPIS